MSTLRHYPRAASFAAWLTRPALWRFRRAASPRWPADIRYRSPHFAILPVD